MRSFLSSESLCSTGNSQKNTHCSEHIAIHVINEIIKDMLSQNLLTAPVQLKTSDQWLSVYVHCVDCVHISLQKSKIVQFAFAEQPHSKKHAGLQNTKITDNCFPLYIQPIYCSLYNNKHMHAEDNKNVTHTQSC